MRHIQKQDCPEGLQKYRNTPGATYRKMGEDSPEEKKELRKCLLEEQGYICGYCGSQIDENDSVIEHIKCRSKYPHLQLEYTNMICSCLGGQNKRRKNPQYPLYCDASKNGNELPITPLDECCYNVFLFDETGEIHANDCDDAAVSINVLNLNNAKLRNRRRAAIDAYRYLSDEDVNWKEERDRLKIRHNNKFKEYSFILEQYICNYRLAKR